MNLAELFRAETPEQIAGCFAFAEFFHLFHKVHTKK